MNTSTKTLAGITICIVLVASILVISIQPYPLVTYSEVTFELIDPGEGYNYATREGFAITNATFWESLWSILYSGHFPIPQAPTVNFTSEMLIAVFQGERGSSGYSTNITKILVSTEHYLVLVDEIHPGVNCGLLTVMTYPYQIVKISNNPQHLPVQFIYNITIHDCG